MSTRAQAALSGALEYRGPSEVNLRGLTQAEAAMNAVMRVVPSTVLGSWVTPSTVNELVEVLAAVTDALLDSMAESETLQRVLDERARDIEGLRRILGTGR